MTKKESRLKRSAKTRYIIKKNKICRLTVHRTPRHIYAQIISIDGNFVLTCANTLQNEIKEQIKYGGNIEAAKVVGNSIARKAIEKGITKVAFDRSGFKYHGRVKALADAARENGLSF